MALYLRCVADQVLRAGWEPSNEHLAIMFGENVVGSLKKVGSGASGRPAGPATREEAQAQFAAAWRAWLNGPVCKRSLRVFRARPPKRYLYLGPLLGALTRGLCRFGLPRPRAQSGLAACEAHNAGGRVEVRLDADLPTCRAYRDGV